MTDFSPREIVSELDRFIVGQADAKRAVSIALRNRWRRLQLTGSLREEVLPKNILMIGPTGVGKTEIARRLAKLAGAPLHQGRSHEIHRGRLCRPRRRTDHPRSRRSRDRANPRAQAQGRAGPRPARRRGSRAGCPGRRQLQRRDARFVSQEAARRRTQRQGNRDRDPILRRNADVRNSGDAGRADGRDLDRRHFRQDGRAHQDAPPDGRGFPRASGQRGIRQAAGQRSAGAGIDQCRREQRHRVPRRDRQDLRARRRAAQATSRARACSATCCP